MITTRGQYTFKVVRKIVTVTLLWFCMSVPAAEFKLIGEHPTSRLTAYPAIRTLKAFDGRLYLGYGDWDRFPATVITSYNPAAREFRLEFSAPTDAIGDYREIGGVLYLPSTDPGFYEKGRDFSYLKEGVWRDGSPAGMTHAFDLATVDGSDLWLAGSRDYWAAVYRSVDGGQNWEEMTLHSALGRYYWCFGLRGRLYVQDTFYEGTNATRIETARNTNYTKATTVGIGAFQFVVGLAGKVPAGGDSAHPLVTFDTAEWRTIRDNVYDFTLRGTNLLTLESGAIWMASSLTATQAVWQRMDLTNVPPSSRSIEILGDYVYVGDAGGRLWAAPLGGGVIETDVPQLTNQMADEFGRALSFDGNLLAIGAPDHFGAVPQSGQVTVWQAPAEGAGTDWRRMAEIDPPVPSFSGWFGKDVALRDGLLAIVEAGRDTGRNNRGISAQVHLYEGSGEGWRHRTNLNINFAKTVAIDSGWLAVGASVETGITATRLHLYKVNIGPEGVSATPSTNIQVAAPLEFWKPQAVVALEGNICVIGSASDATFWGGPGEVKVYYRDDSDTWRVAQVLQSPGNRLNSTGEWRHNRAAGVWQADGEVKGLLTTRLFSPHTSVEAGGMVYLSFSHRWSFERAQEQNWDGGQVRFSINGGPYTNVSRANFIQNPYNGGVASASWSELRGQSAFVSQSVGYRNSNRVTSVCTLGPVQPGDKLSIQFLYSTDAGFNGAVPNWEIDAVSFSQNSNGVTNIIASHDFDANGEGYSVVTTNSRPADQFGWSVALKDRWLAVGAPRADEVASQGGAVYLYERTDTNGLVPEFALRQKILPPSAQAEANFGTSVALRNGRLLAGAPGAVINGKRLHGTVYSYRQEGDTWKESGEISAFSGSEGEFGMRVAMSDDWLAASSRFSKANGTFAERLKIEALGNPGGLISKVLRGADGTISFGISGELGRTYWLQRTSSLLAPEWIDLTQVTLTSSSTNLVDNISVSDSRRFYRLRSLD